MPTIPYKLKNGTKVSGVTTIINENLAWNKQQLMYWAWKEGSEGRNYRDTAQKAADSGTICHYLIECDLKSVKPDLTQYPKEAIDKAETGYINFLTWKKERNFEVVATEIHLVSEVHEFGGTPDCIVKINGKKKLFDWKTSRGLYQDMLFQLAAYYELYNENFPKDPIIDGTTLLQFNKENMSYKEYFWDRFPGWVFEDFLNLKKLHDHKKLMKDLI